MNAIKRLMAIACLLLCFILITQSGFAQPGSHFIIGQKTSDSTGTISVSAAAFQQQLFLNVETLKTGYAISGTMSLRVGGKSYLMFTAAGGGVDSLMVAVELSADNNNLFIHTDKAQNVHLCKKAGSCNECLFVFNRIGRVIGCSCTEMPISPEWECNHRLERSKLN